MVESDEWNDASIEMMTISKELPGEGDLTGSATRIRGTILEFVSGCWIEILIIMLSILVVVFTW